MNDEEFISAIKDASTPVHTLTVMGCEVDVYEDGTGFMRGQKTAEGEAMIVKLEPTEMSRELARVAQQLAKMRLYAYHRPECGMHDGTRCDCGLSAILEVGLT